DLAGEILEADVFAVLVLQGELRRRLTDLRAIAGGAVGDRCRGEERRDDRRGYEGEEAFAHEILRLKKGSSLLSAVWTASAQAKRSRRAAGRWNRYTPAARRESSASRKRPAAGPR